MDKRATLYKHNRCFIAWKAKNTITSHLLQYACVHLQLLLGVWNSLEEREELVNRVTTGGKFMKELEHVCKYRMGRKKCLDQRCVNLDAF